MSPSNNDGGPAFPGPSDYNQDGTPVWGGATGMTLRDWFAGQALAGMLAHPDTRLAGLDFTESMREGPWAIADAMLAAREKKK